jgi:hypothetical protein
MKNTVKFLLDLSDIGKDLELKKEFSKEIESLKIAAVRNGKILASTEIEISKLADVSKVPVTLEFEYPRETPPGVYIMIGPSLSEKEFLGAEAKKIWVSPRKFKDAVADLTKERILIPLYLFRRWLILCRTYTISGKVVKRVWRWDSATNTWVSCDEPVPGAKVEAFDVDCWWCWWHKDLVGSAITNSDGTFEIKFRWCCLLWYPILRKRWIIDPDMLRHIAREFKPQIGPIPPEAMKSPVDFERFLGDKLQSDVGSIPQKDLMGIGTSPGAEKEIRVTRPIDLDEMNMKTADFSLAEEKYTLGTYPIEDLISKIKPILPLCPCWPWPFKCRDCSPDIVFKVTQECEGAELIIRNEGVLQTRWNIPTSLNVTLFASADACSIPCEEPPIGDCLKFSWVNCVEVENIGTSAGPPDLRGYAYPGTGDNPFAEILRIRGLFGSGSDVDYFKVQDSYNGGAFQDVPQDNLLGFTRSYWAPPPASPPGTPAKWNHVPFKAEPVDGKIVYKTLIKAEEENPLPVGWTWGYLWNDFSTLFRWDSKDMPEGDGLYTFRLVGYRWNDTTKKLVNEHVMETCDVQPGQEETVMIRIDNRLANDPLYQATGRPCGPGTIHLCTYEPDCDFRKIFHVRKDANGTILGIKLIGPCDIIELSDNDEVVIHFNASVPKNTKDGHLLGYHMHAHWGENKVFNILTNGTLEKDPDELVGPTYGHTFVGPQGVYRGTLPATDPEHDRPYWFGGDFKATVKGDKFQTCAYTLKLRVWKRTIVDCQNPYYVHVNWCSYSFTIKKV